MSKPETEVMRDRLSKLDPTPETGAKTAVNDPIPIPVARPKPPVPAPEKKQPEERKEPSESCFLAVGAGYRIAHKPGSGWSTLMRVLAREGKFEQVSDTLDSPTFDPTNKQAATDLCAKMFVRKEALEKLVRADPEWKAHCEKRKASLEQRAKNGDVKAQQTLANAQRVAGGEWIGSVREIISTCNGSYNASASNSKENKNVTKFKEAGLVFRQFPRRSKKKGDPIFCLLFPLKHMDKVSTAISTATGEIG